MTTPDNTDTGRSALDLSAMMAAGMLGAEAVTRQTLAAIERCDDKTVFTLLTSERAGREASAAAKRRRGGRPASLLDGVPVAWKDLFDLEGIVTTAGARCLAGDPPAPSDAAIVQRLAAAGMVSVGRVNMTEFAFSGIGLNPHFGTPVNPHGSDRVPGGSSSGSAVAVARGLVAVSIGTDTGGSVRIPAAFNGIVGYKTSSGRWPMAGVFPLSRSLDTLGVLCRNVADAVLVDAAARGLTGPTVTRGAVADLRLLIPTNVVFDGCEPAVVANFEAAIERLAAAGARIERRRIGAFDEILALTARHGAIVTAEAHALHKARIEGAASALMDRRVVARAKAATNMSMADYIALLDARRRLIAETAAALGGGILVAYPTVAHVAPSIAALEADDDLFAAVNAKTLRNTLLGNFLDWCGVSIPTGTDAEGMPTGLLFSGAPEADEALLAAALAAEDIVRGQSR